MASRQSLQFMRFPGRAGEPESFTALPVGATIVWLHLHLPFLSLSSDSPPANRRKVGKGCLYGNGSQPDLFPTGASPTENPLFVAYSSKRALPISCCLISTGAAFRCSLIIRLPSTCSTSLMAFSLCYLVSGLGFEWGVRETVPQRGRSRRSRSCYQLATNKHWKNNDTTNGATNKHASLIRKRKPRDSMRWESMSAISNRALPDGISTCSTQLHV